MRKFLFFIFASLCLPLSSAQATVSEDIQQVSGFWQTPEREGIVQLYLCDTHLCGRFRWVAPEENGEISRDTRNPDSEKRTRPLCGMQFMGGFSPRGGGLFESGWIYSPRHGADFSADLKILNPNEIELRGYVFIPLFGQSQIWTRADTPPDCPAIR